MLVGLGRGRAVGRAVSVGVRVGLAVIVGLDVCVGLGVRVGVAVGVLVTVGEAVDVAVFVRISSARLGAFVAPSGSAPPASEIPRSHSIASKLRPISAIPPSAQRRVRAREMVGCGALELFTATIC